MTATPLVRAMVREDLDDVGNMAAELVRYHHEQDPQRFLEVPDVARGYARYFSSQLDDPKTVLLVAEKDGRRVGYAYARLEDRDWNALRDACGALHDIFVIAEARRSGVARALLDDVCARLRALGAPRVVLGTAVGNQAAQRLFDRFGFRPTMLEMTRELD